MTLSEDQLREFAIQEQEDEWITLARKKTSLYKMHYYGTGLSDHLTQVQGLENGDQIKLRKKYAISNKSLLRSLFAPTSNAWSAKGGLVTVDSENNSESIEEDFISKTKSALNGHSSKEYMQNMWFDRFITDPNGLLFTEISEEEPKPVNKSIFEIKKMLVKGVKPEYVVFEPKVEKRQESILGQPKETKYTWVVDDAFYYKLEVKSDDIVIVEKIVNTFGYVPAFQNSPIVDTETLIKLSPIDTQLDLLDSYLIDNSVNNIYKKLHGFPAFVFYSGKCESCKGQGEIKGDTCTTCNGSGQSMKRDVSDGIALKTPKNKDAPQIRPADVIAYVQPALETWQEQRTELEHLFHLIHFSMWGSNMEKQDNETATGRWIDYQPVVNKLERFSDIFQDAEKRLLESFAKVFYPSQTIDVHVSYGRRYLIETPDQLWKKYLETIEKGGDDSTKDIQLSQYIETEFQSDEIMKEYRLNLAATEPLVHYNVETVLSMEVPEELKQRKIAFTSWKNRVPISEVVENTQEQNDKSLIEFTNKFYQDGKTREPEQAKEVQADEVSS